MYGSARSPPPLQHNAPYGSAGGHSSALLMSQTANFFNTIAAAGNNNSSSPSNNHPSSNSSFGTAPPQFESSSTGDVPQFAPNFLFGAQQQSKRRSFATPTRQQVPGYGSPGILKNRDGSTSGGKNVHWSPVLVREHSKSPTGDERKFGAGAASRLAASGNKPATSSLWNGPPLRSLNEDVVAPPEKVSRLDNNASASAASARNAAVDNDDEDYFGQPRDASERAAPDVEELEDNGGEGDSIYWVTVFGFGADQLKQILELFARHGDIMAQKMPKHGGCNWVHIRYSSPVHAKQALDKNAILFQGHMIGVVPCKDREALEDEAAASNTTPVVAAARQTATRSRNNNSQQLNGSSLLLDDNSNNSSFLLNGSRMVPSTSYNKQQHNNSNPLPSRARLSMSSRAGMRPLNASIVSNEAAAADHSMDSTSFQQQRGGGGDDSFIGKLWNIFTAAGGGNSNAGGI